jgi:hypothetical protein
MFKKTVLAAAILLLLIQLVPKSIFPTTNPPVNAAETLEASAQAPPPEVDAILKRACYNCHSNDTVWPWYSRVAPVSWLVSNDVSEGRHHMNFSEWGTYDAKSVAHHLQHICEEVDSGDMPLWYYRPMHPNSKLTAANKSAICAWTRGQK